MQDLLTALALVLVIEGLIYAVLPETMKRWVVAILSLPVQQIRLAGLVFVALGVSLVWLIRQSS